MKSFYVVNHYMLTSLFNLLTCDTVCNFVFGITFKATYNKGYII